jgi:GAF domain-containing protein
MAFALQLQESLREIETQVPAAPGGASGLGLILSRYLREIEAQSDSFILTSILLRDGNVLRHGAAPTLPDAYCAAIDGLEFGPATGSCGTATHFGRPIYVTDIATDPLWADYKGLALQHGLRACWSTPIFDEERNVIGTFAIYHLSPGAPTNEEIASIATITDSVAKAIIWSRSAQELARGQPQAEVPLRQA